MKPALVRVLSILACILALGAVGARAIDLGPIYDEFPLTLVPGKRSEVAGPLVNWETTTNEWGWTFAPIMTYRKNPGVENTSFDLLYPILSLDRYGTEYRWHIFQLFAFAGGNNQQQQTKRRFTLFPFYFQQRSPNPDENYTALLPIYGTMKNRIFRDRIHFILMPLYVQTEKRGVVTDNYLLPFFHYRHGAGVKGWQFWPIVGNEHKPLTTKTNSFNEIEPMPGHDKFFAAWPFFFRNDIGIGSTNAEKQRIFLPFYASMKSPARDTVAFGFPLGFTRIDNREGKYREWGFPWPLVDFARGEGKTVNRVWPLFGFGRNASLESDFVAWPIYKRNRFHGDLVDRERTRILFFLYSDVNEKNLTTGSAFRRTDLWPLFTARRDHNGNERLQIFTILEPLIPENQTIQRLYSPIWSIWRSEKNPKTGASSESFLWNLYRRDETKTEKNVSFFFGLFQCRTADDGKHFKLFYFPVR